MVGTANNHTYLVTICIAVLSKLYIIVPLDHSAHQPVVKIPLKTYLMRVKIDQACPFKKL